MLKQPFKITKLDDKADIERLNILLEQLFKYVQPQETKYLTFTGAGTWIDKSSLKEKEIVLCENTDDNERRLYTKINDTLRYIVWT